MTFPCYEGCDHNTTMVNASNNLPLNFESKLITIVNKALQISPLPFSPTSSGTTFPQVPYTIAHIPSFCCSNRNTVLHLGPWHLIFSIPETVCPQIFSLLDPSGHSSLSSSVFSKRSSLITQHALYKVLVITFNCLCKRQITFQMILFIHLLVCF